MRQIRKRLPQIGGRNLWRTVQRMLRLFRFPPIGRDRFFEVINGNQLKVGLRKAKRVKTTYSRHSYAVQPNRLRSLPVERPLQALVADITYISVGQAHAYLFLITDAHSRMIVGHHLSEDLSHRGAIAALEMAHKSASLEGVVHHSDRGAQYCCHDFLKALDAKKMKGSMTDADHAAQNALAECMNGILKREFLLDSEFKSIRQAQEAINDAVFTFNHIRIHGALNGRTPAEVHYGVDGTFNLWAWELRNFSAPYPVAA